MTPWKWRRISIGTVLMILGCGVLLGTRFTAAQNPNGPPGLAGRRVPPSVSSLDFKQLQYLRSREILELDPNRISYVFDAALRNPQRFQRDAFEAANNILRRAPGSPQASIADAYVVITQFRMQGGVNDSLQQQLARIASQYPFSPAVAVGFQTICEDLIGRGEHRLALELLDNAEDQAVNDQQKQWFSGYAELIKKNANLSLDDDPAGEDEAEIDEPDRHDE